MPSGRATEQVKKFLEEKRYLFEILLAFIALNCLNFIFLPHDLGFKKVVLHPYWIIVLLIASQYGFFPGLLAGGLASLQYLYFFFEGIPTQQMMERAVESHGLILPVAFVIVGVVLGEISQRRIHGERDRKFREKEWQEKIKRLNAWLDSGEKARRVLEMRIVRQSTTVRGLYEAARKFEGMDLNAIYQATLEILANHFQIEKSSLYLKEAGYYVLKSAFGWDTQHQVEGKIPVGSSLMDLVFNESKLMTIRDILERPDTQKYLKSYGELLAMVPLRSEKGEALGVVNIEKMDFLAFNKPQLELVELMVEWAGQAIRNVSFFKSTREKVVKDEVYGIGTFLYFEDMLVREFNRAKDFDLPLAAAVMKINRYGFLSAETQELLSGTLVSILKQRLASTDQLYRYRFDGTFAVIAPMRHRAQLAEILKSVEEDLKKISGELTLSTLEFQKEIPSANEWLKTALRECKIGD